MSTAMRMPESSREEVRKRGSDLKVTRGMRTLFFGDGAADGGGG